MERQKCSACDRNLMPSDIEEGRRRCDFCRHDEQVRERMPGLIVKLILLALWLALTAPIVLKATFGW